MPDLRFIPLASSSHGNAYLLDDGKTCLLIECGVSYKKLQRLTGFGVSGIIGCLISHEHHDHAGCYEQLIKSGIPVYASRGTAEALECDLFEILEDRERVTIGSLEVLPFPTFHDAAEPMGFLVRSQSDGEKLVFATDTVNLGYQFPEVNIAAIECNYDENILSRAERMPEKVRHRITNSHMSVVRACLWLERLDKSRLKEVYLMHLSDACSDERNFHRMAQCAVGSSVRVMICPKEKK
nr:MAG TPA: YycJ-like MBL-fold protein [Caudoviricetes sp.]